MDQSLVMSNAEESGEVEREIHQMVMCKAKRIKDKLSSEEQSLTRNSMIRKEWQDIVMNARRNYLIHTFKKYEFPRIIDKIRKSYTNSEQKHDLRMKQCSLTPDASHKKYRIVQKIENIFNWRKVQLQKLTNLYLEERKQKKEAPQMIQEQYKLEKELTKDMAQLGIINNK